VRENKEEKFAQNDRESTVEGHKLHSFNFVYYVNILFIYFLRMEEAISA
jgi:hypothetical protein